jgi:DNA-binding Xre family transcriptional regulator
MAVVGAAKQLVQEFRVAARDIDHLQAALRACHEHHITAAHAKTSRDRRERCLGGLAVNRALSHPNDQCAIMPAAAAAAANQAAPRSRSARANCGTAGWMVLADGRRCRGSPARGLRAARVGVTIVNLSILKNGHAKAIRFGTLTKLCEVLDCQPGDLLTWRKQGQQPAPRK